MSTFRELFDEDERNELHVSLTARLNSIKSRLKRASMGTEHAPNVVTIERLEAKVSQLEGMIDTVAEESN